jgi:MOSC domain-containing protein YiiM
VTTQSSPTIEELDSAWLAAPRPPRPCGWVRLICVRTSEGVHATPERALVTPERGLEGDRWLANPRRMPDAQLTLMNVQVAELITRGRGQLDAPGDNFLVDLDLSEDALPAGTTIRLGEALIELTALPHTGCKKFSERFGLEALKWVNGRRDLRLRGANCRVLEAGSVAVGDTVEVVDGGA